MAAGASRERVMRNGGGNNTNGALPEATRAAISAGAGANANSDGIRSLSRRDAHAVNIASGVAGAATSNASAMITAENPAPVSPRGAAPIEELWTNGSASSKALYGGGGTADQQQFR